VFKRIEFVGVPVRDQDRALSFWRDTLGLHGGVGVEFVQPPKKESWGTSAIFKDPDGNSFVMGSN
jgi:hypothetical protein